MAVVIFILQALAATLGCLAALISIPLFFPFRWPAAAMWILKVYVSSLSFILALTGVSIAVIGLLTGPAFIGWLGMIVAFVYGIHFISVTRAPSAGTGFDQAFGPQWENSIMPEQKIHLLSRRTVLSLPVVPKPRLEQDLSFATLPDTTRQLLCDVWQPPENVRLSGLAFIYLHGSAFYFLDKDYGTRPLFRHLAAQGHVVMDVAYRLAPETDILGMVHDTKRAIAWIKEQAGAYGIKPSCVVVGGGSAGAHLALMAAYTSDDPQFTPKDLEGKDVRVRAAVSLYAPADLKELYYHTNQHLTTRSVPGRPKKAVPTKMPAWMVKSIGADSHRLGFDKDFKEVGTLAPLLGGHPDECPERYALLSPVSHVHSGCPHTLLIHGEHDIMAPVYAIRRLHRHLVENKVPVVLHILPQTDHGFDLVLPKIAPAAHNALYDVERFLALIAVKEEITEYNTTTTDESIKSRAIPSTVMRTYTGRGPSL